MAAVQAIASEVPVTKGYHRLADTMGIYPERAIFRRFGPLNMLNLLSLQAELVELDIRFRNICKLDNDSSVAEEKEFSASFRKLRASGNSRQHQVLLKIRRKLLEYNAALLQVAQLTQLAVPDDTEFQGLQDWLIEGKGGNGFLQDFEHFTWQPLMTSESQRNKLRRDLVGLHTSSTEKSLFFRQLTSRLLDWYHRLWGFRSKGRQSRAIIDEESGIMHYNESTLVRINTGIVSFVSSVLPVLAISILYCIKTTTSRIGAMVGFTFLFAFCLAAFTKARMLEIFASTSA